MKKKISNMINDYNTGNNRVIDALMEENKLDPTKFQEYFPDYGDTNFSDYNYFMNTIMTKLIGTEEFVAYVESHKDKKFCVMGDYDCDGVMATTIMVLGLQALDISCTYVVPNRLTDGYAMTENNVDDAIAQGAEVLVTVDNGIGTRVGTAYAKSKGLDVIVTDHHMPEEGELPDTDIIIDPKINGDKESDICGAYVAFKLIHSLFAAQQNFNTHDIYSLKCNMMVFASIATVADMMPLLGENRYLMKYALNYTNVLKHKNNWSGRVLKIISGLGGYFALKDSDKMISAETFGYNISPTINAVSRVTGDVTPLISDILACDKQGVYINGYRDVNKQRQQYTRELVKFHKKSKNSVNVDLLESDNFEFPIKGLVGLMANSISNNEHKPAIVGLEKDGRYEFSCRSIPGYSIYQAFTRLKEAYPDFDITGGGHDMALGMSFPTTNDSLNVVREFFENDFAKNSSSSDLNIYELEVGTIEEIKIYTQNLVYLAQHLSRCNLYIPEILKA